MAQSLPSPHPVPERAAVKGGWLLIPAPQRWKISCYSESGSAGGVLNRHFGQPMVDRFNDHALPVRSSRLRLGQAKRTNPLAHLDGHQEVLGIHLPRASDSCAFENLRQRTLNPATINVGTAHCK